MLLILDLDETLIYASTEMLDRPADFQVGKYFVYRRPGLSDFLEFVIEHFSVAVWTSSSPDYADEIVDHLFPDKKLIEFIWARERCTRRTNLDTYEMYWVKDLKKLKKHGYRLEEVLIVDDSPEKLERNYGNHIRVTPFEGSPMDNELRMLALYLEQIKNVANVRALEKRNWKCNVERRRAEGSN